jgi:ABC-2 type transport system ATP-binding protein/lipopolysaccharide transport system ATP-binding protein
MGGHVFVFQRIPLASRVLGLGGFVASIELASVSVNFPIYDSSTRSLKKRLMVTKVGGDLDSGRGSSRVSVVHALTDVDLILRHGDRIGLVGHNGAGKTTLLRVLAGIYEPCAGQVTVSGSVVPLFDITLGMDPESTGYENIVLRGLFLGLTRQQIDDRMDDIAEFTELGDFLSVPIRTYSTGMQMRLAFAVATSIDPDILLMDEGIGAGDAAFLEKASQRLLAFTNKAAITVLASHSEKLVMKMCDTVILMDHGRVKQVGPTEQVLSVYQERGIG